MDAQVKQQVVEAVKKATNILVTVSSSPSVDQLAACIGMTLLLNKLGKHTTAVFSGEVPSTIEFLHPEKTLQSNTDSLRDFIISLDKSKADKLRYKVEDQFVRIFITPYRTSINENDLQFNQGELNVEVVLALGVSDQGQLDAAITAHGKILHDATVISVNAGDSKAPALGQVDWRDQGASSLCEMVVSISEAFGPNLIDAQMATAFLTGIVAETKRFGNTKTTPRSMTMSAQLMAAGANQQLIVNELEPPKPQVPDAAEPSKEPTPQPPQPVPEQKPKELGTLSIEHDDQKQDKEGADAQTNEISIDNEGTLLRAEELLKAEQANESSAVSPLPPKEDKPAPSPPEITRRTDSTLTASEGLSDTDTADQGDKTDNQSPPKPHALLTDQANNGSAFAAGMQTELEEPPIDPLAEDHSRTDGILSHAPDLGTPEGQKDTTAPPPFPPPMNLGGGVVIPPPYGQDSPPPKTTT